jgi:hypothetical protein
MSSIVARKFGSGTVLTLGVAGVAIVLLLLGHTVGWNATWRAFGVTPILPSFVDMHIINDYAACAWKGNDVYAPYSCSTANFNIPPTWLLVGLFGVDGTDSLWLSAAIIAATVAVMVLLIRGRPWSYGILALVSLISPSVMMGVERGNLDLLILALVGSAALMYEEKKVGRACGALALLCLGVVLKLVPIFCVSLVARFSRFAFIFVCALAAFSLLYMDLALKYILLVRQNAPTTFVLSYGYKAIFLGFDYVRSEAGLKPLGLADTWLPACTAAAVLIAAAFAATKTLHKRRQFCLVEPSVAGTAFLFGAGIYCGTYLLGTNFVYRLMFLLLCIPQLLDWQMRWRKGDKAIGICELGLFIPVMGVLWLNGNAEGHSMFLLLPQLLDWFLFYCLAAALMFNFLRSSADAASHRGHLIEAR